MASESLVNIGSDDGLLPEGTNQALTSTSVDFSSFKSHSIHLRVILSKTFEDIELHIQDCSHLSQRPVGVC